MKLRMIVSGLVLCGAMVGMAQAGEPVKLAERPLDVKQLAAQKPQVYTLTAYAAFTTKVGDQVKKEIKSQIMGTMSLATEVKGEQVIFRDVMSMKMMGGMAVEMTTYGKLDALLRMQRVELCVKQGEKVREEGVMEVGAGNKAKFVSRRNGPNGPQEQAMERDLPADTLTLGALLRLTPQLSREKGQVWTLENVSLELEMRPQSVKPGEQPYTLTCDGPEQVKIGDKSYDATRYTLDSRSRFGPMLVWVDKDGVICQFMMGKEMRATLGEPGPVESDPMIEGLLKMVEPKPVAPTPATPK